jgi:hypothetical protein
VIVGTVAVYGLSAGPIARKLGLAEQNPEGVLIVGGNLLARKIGQGLKEHGFKVMLLGGHTEMNEARQEGLLTHSSPIHAGHLLDRIELTGLGRLLALSSNETINLLAVHRFRSLFGQAQVFQLVPELRPGEWESESRDLNGRFLFGPGLTYHELEAGIHRGAVLKATELTGPLGPQDFVKRFGPNAVPLFVIPHPGRLKVITADDPVTAGMGQILLILVTEEDISAEQGAIPLHVGPTVGRKNADG